MAADGGEAARPLSDTQRRDDASSGSLPVNFSPEDLADNLMRGVFFHEAVSGFGKHWQADSLASEVGRSWAYSTKVDRNKYFVSHSWRSSRWIKWLSLLALSNSLLAALGGTLAAVVTRLYYHYHMTTFAVSQSIQLGSTTWDVPMLVAPSVAGFTVATVLFFEGHRLRQVANGMGLSSPWTLFLDKLVIHQDDPELMKRGIALLGAYLNSSDVFLVLWSEHYLSRLWCSYEMAVFLFLASSGHQGDIVIWPQPFTRVMVAKICSVWLVVLPTCAWAWFLPGSTPGGQGWLIAVSLFNLIPSVIAVGGIAQLHHDVEALQHQVAGYSLSNCQCFSEDDRATVEASVAAWFDPDAQDKGKAIALFDEFVRRRFSEAVAQVFAESGRPPRGASFLMGLLDFWTDTLQLVQPHDMPWKTFASLLGNSVVEDICGTMLLVAFQYGAIARIQRCFRGGRYTAVPRDERSETTGYDTMRSCAELVVEVVAYNLIFMICVGLSFAPAMLPLHANICVSLGIVALTAYVYW